MKPFDYDHRDGCYVHVIVLGLALPVVAALSFYIALVFFQAYGGRGMVAGGYASHISISLEGDQRFRDVLVESSNSGVILIHGTVDSEEDRKALELRVKEVLLSGKICSIDVTVRD